MPFSEMKALHHKGSFATFTRALAVQAPESHLLRDRAAIAPFLSESTRWVFKPAYSRFAAKTLARPGVFELANISPTEQFPWVAQRWVEGREVCSYSLLVNGELRAHACYFPKYRVGVGSGIFFEPVDPPEVEQFVRDFGRATAYTGQVGFDFIQGVDGKTSVLECNPRATSGIHLFADQRTALVDAFLKGSPHLLKPAAKPRMIGLCMALFGGPRHFWKRSFWSDFFTTPDVVFSSRDPCPAGGQFIGLGEVVLRALSRRRGLIPAATDDIEWDGQDLGGPVTLSRPGHGEQPMTSEAGYASNYVRNCIGELGRRAVRNVDTEVWLLDAGGVKMPVTVDSGENSSNSYVVSPTAAYVRYAEFELREIPSQILVEVLRPVIRTLGRFLTFASADRLVQINNWLLSTNIYPQCWAGSDLNSITKLLIERFPHHAIGLRSLNYASNKALINQLRQAGYFLVASRQVYLFDATVDTPDFSKRHNVQIDFRELNKGAFSVIDGADLQPEDYPRLEELYNKLYLEKYSPLNPQFTADWMQRGQQQGWLKLSALKDCEGIIVGVVGFFSMGGVITAPIVGYDTGLPQHLGLYRLLTALCLKEAISRKLLLNFSSGAAHFKRLRGGVPQIEYSAVYTRHLSLRQRLAWRVLQAISNGVGVPLMRVFKL
jgi:hypothetical protein